MTVDTGRRVPTEAELADLVGTRFPAAGHARAVVGALVLDSMLADPADAARTRCWCSSSPPARWLERGRVVRRVRATEADGPMAGETETVVHRRCAYRVSGEIVSATRKGRRTGVFDIVGYRLDLHGEDGALCASTTNSIVFPRRGEIS
nr:hypothetical protein [Rhodococcus ruber]